MALQNPWKNPNPIAACRVCDENFCCNDHRDCHEAKEHESVAASVKNLPEICGKCNTFVSNYNDLKSNCIKNSTKSGPLKEFSPNIMVSRPRKRSYSAMTSSEDKSSICQQGPIERTIKRAGRKGLVVEEIVKNFEENEKVSREISPRFEELKSSSTPLCGQQGLRVKLLRSKFEAPRQSPSRIKPLPRQLKKQDSLSVKNLTPAQSTSVPVFQITPEDKPGEESIYATPNYPVTPFIPGRRSEARFSNALLSDVSVYATPEASIASLKIPLDNTEGTEEPSERNLSVVANDNVKSDDGNVPILVEQIEDCSDKLETTESVRVMPESHSCDEQVDLKRNLSSNPSSEKDTSKTNSSLNWLEALPFTNSSFDAETQAAVNPLSSENTLSGKGPNSKTLKTSLSASSISQKGFMGLEKKAIETLSPKILPIKRSKSSEEFLPTPTVSGSVNSSIMSAGNFPCVSQQSALFSSPLNANVYSCSMMTEDLSSVSQPADLFSTSSRSPNVNSTILSVGDSPNVSQQSALFSSPSQSANVYNSSMMTKNSPSVSKPTALLSTPSQSVNIYNSSMMTEDLSNVSQPTALCYTPSSVSAHVSTSIMSAEDSPNVSQSKALFSTPTVSVNVNSSIMSAEDSPNVSQLTAIVSTSPSASAHYCSATTADFSNVSQPTAPSTPSLSASINSSAVSAEDSPNVCQPAARLSTYLSGNVCSSTMITEDPSRVSREALLPTSTPSARVNSTVSTEDSPDFSCQRTSHSTSSLSTNFLSCIKSCEDTSFKSFQSGSFVNAAPEPENEPEEENCDPQREDPMAGAPMVLKRKPIWLWPKRRRPIHEGRQLPDDTSPIEDESSP